MNQGYWNERHWWQRRQSKRTEKYTRTRMKNAMVHSRWVLSSVLNGYNNTEYYTHLYTYCAHIKNGNHFGFAELPFNWLRSCGANAFFCSFFFSLHVLCFIFHCRHENCNGCCFVGTHFLLFQQFYSTALVTKTPLEKKLKHKHTANSTDSTNFLAFFSSSFVVCVRSIKMWKQFYRRLLSVSHTFDFVRTSQRCCFFERLQVSYSTW